MSKQFGLFKNSRIYHSFYEIKSICTFSNVKPNLLLSTVSKCFVKQKKPANIIFEYQKRTIKHQMNLGSKLRKNESRVKIIKRCFHGARRNEKLLTETDSALITTVKHLFLVIFYGRSRCAEALENMKTFAICLTRLVSRQCKVHTSQKLIDAMRFYSFYSRIWGEEMAGKMISGIRKSLLVTGKSLLLSAVCVTPFDWESNCIKEKQLDRCVKEIETVEDLCLATVVCPDCLKRQVVDKVISDIDYCMCGNKLGYTDQSRQHDSWRPFLERENILVWRKKHDEYSHLYAYKVYGTYEDVSLSAFMEVQLNSSFRSQWDSSALELKVVNSHPESNSDLLYWLVKFPHFFANRDYVFKRRYKVNEVKKEVVIMNELAPSGIVTEEKGVHRVNEYWSIMVLKAKKSFQEPGMSYTLTYFDNPGTSLPSAVTNFVATTAFPDFLKKVHTAAMSLQREWNEGKDVYVTVPTEIRSRKLQLSQIPPPKSSINLREEQIPTIESHSDSLTNQDSSKSLCPDKESFPSDDDTNMRISLRLKNSVVDLMEAIEVITPDLENKTALARKIEKIFNYGKPENSLEFITKLEELKDKTKMFIENSAKKKQESLKTMNEFSTKKSRYDHYEESTLFHVQNLLVSINDVLQADKDMRIGKGLTSNLPSTTSSRINNGKLNKSSSEPTNMEGEKVIQDDTKIESSTNQKLKLPNCECCSCGSSNGWFSFGSSWWGARDQKFCQTCVCDHNKSNPASFTTSKTPNPDINSNSTECQPIISTPTYSYWQYLTFWKYWSSPPTVIAQEEVNELNNCKHSLSAEAECPTNVDLIGNLNSNNAALDESTVVIWYWMPITRIYDIVTHVYNYFTKDKVS